MQNISTSMKRMTRNEGYSAIADDAERCSAPLTHYANINEKINQTSHLHEVVTIKRILYPYRFNC
jgi:hypothetical protein